MERRWNARAGGKWHNSQMRKYGSEPGSPWWEASALATSPLLPLTFRVRLTIADRRQEVKLRPGGRHRQVAVARLADGGRVVPCNPLRREAVGSPSVVEDLRLRRQQNANFVEAGLPKENHWSNAMSSMFFTLENSNVTYREYNPDYCNLKAPQLPHISATRHHTSEEVWRANEVTGEYGADPERKSGGNGRSSRKPADHRHRLARFPHASVTGVTRPGIETGSPRWAASRLPAEPPRPLGKRCWESDDRGRNRSVLLQGRQDFSRVDEHEVAVVGAAHFLGGLEVCPRLQEQQTPVLQLHRLHLGGLEVCPGLQERQKPVLQLHRLHRQLRAATKGCVSLQGRAMRSGGRWGRCECSSRQRRSGPGAALGQWGGPSRASASSLAAHTQPPPAARPPTHGSANTATETRVARFVVKRGECGAAVECQHGVGGTPPRKPANQCHPCRMDESCVGGSLGVEDEWHEQQGGRRESIYIAYMISSLYTGKSANFDRGPGPWSQCPGDHTYGHAMCMVKGEEDAGRRRMATPCTRDGREDGSLEILTPRLLPRQWWDHHQQQVRWIQHPQLQDYMLLGNVD
ncbi:hypothetical protein PR048_028547 [Dryococelus australis]|uniref:Uncharacterized protein n=1 Tax=Dryococelus australis TaxID=614101 RepID=A0ABQ9GAY8_9NEOP|nr:hypothetical protein PR048_028547 [Dryococelus australis]